MRIILLTSLAALTLSTVAAQIPNEMRSSSPRMIAYGRLPDEKNETVQSKFREQEWSPGKVVLQSKRVLSVPLIFDVYSNRLYFLEAGNIMEFLEPVSEFTIDLIQKNDSVTLRFRNGYPAVQKNTEETFYEVLVDGKFQLLRCKAKSIHLYKDEDVPEEKRDYNKEILYVFTPDNKMVMIKKDKDFILQQMPEHAKTILSLADTRKLKLKNEKSLVELFTLLNEQ